MLVFILNSLTQAEIELGNGLPEIRVTGQCLEALKQAGFEVSSRLTKSLLADSK